MSHALTDKIEQAIRHFLWAGSSNQRSMHPISWEVVTLPKEYMRLGILDIHAQCTSLQAKRALSYLNKVPTTWFNLVTVKYGLVRCWGPRSLVRPLLDLRLPKKRLWWKLSAGTSGTLGIRFCMRLGSLPQWSSEPGAHGAANRARILRDDCVWSSIRSPDFKAILSDDRFGINLH
ncbi:RNA-directed DNA polymerase, eukaryota, Reverse transcriptase zinc-binding domain protein [Canna indica]|uniref:RNA-directed DNA polymerase, eukaryota, Reverse transcriptase zinc-binding domain protein n=1 Tax=Canna indica TaxID=4628 RepID=A0AAQ3KR05_9LILI|nr:RNA-directed DNA polymerase, eukaryota, Reverse transcriptase zinc-binding domain protein [Canna indica]